MSSAAPLLLINIIKSNFNQRNPGIICCKFITFNTVSSCWRLIHWFSYRAATRFCSTVRRRAARMRRGRETHQTPLENCSILWVFELGETLSTSWDAFYHKVFTNWTLLNSAYVSIQFFPSFCVKKKTKNVVSLSSSDALAYCLFAYRVGRWDPITADHVFCSCCNLERSLRQPRRKSGEVKEQNRP